MTTKKRCIRFPFCFKPAIGYIEKRFVIKKRYFVCEKHGKISMEAWEHNNWSGEDWSDQKFIKFNEINDY